MKNANKWPVVIGAVLIAFLFYCCGNNEKNVPETTENTAKADDAIHQNIDTTFRNLFEEVNVVKMHLFGTNELEPKQEDYPYAGKKIEEGFMKYLGEGLQPNEVGSVYACYRTEIYNLYVLRVPGKYASSDLVLAKWDNATSKLMKVIDLAMLQCDEGMCHQQDAWLTDLDDDRVLDLVIHTMTNDNGKISDETFTVMSQPSPATFTKASDALTSLAPQTSYVMFHEMKKK